MPTRASTRSAAKPEDAATSKPARTTRTAVSKSRNPDAAVKDEGLAREMERVLRVSEPEPQPKTRATRTPATAKGKEKEAKPSEVKPTARSVSSKPVVKATSATTSSTARRPTAAKTATTGSRAVELTAGPDAGPSTATRPSAISKPAATSARDPARSTARIPSAPAPTSKPTVRESSVAATTTARKSIPSGSKSSTTIATSKTTPANAARTSAATKQPVASGSKPAVSSARAVPAVQARPPTAAPIRPTVSLKGKERERDVVELSVADFPWIDGSSTLSVLERASAAMTALKSSLTILYEPAKLGYKYGADHAAWNTERVDKEMGVCDAAMLVLREADEKGQIARKGIEVERAGQAVVNRAIALDMPRRAFDQLSIARSGLMRQYKNRNPTIPTSISPDTSTGPHPIPAEWLACCWLPVPQDPDTLPDALGILCVQHVLASWSCLIGIEGLGYDLPPFSKYIGHHAAGSDWISPLRMALLFPTAPCCGPSAALTRRIQHVPVTAPHWPHIFSTIVEAYVLSTTAAEVVPPSGRSPEQLWPMLRSWLAAFLPRSRVDLVRVGIASKIIADVLRWTGDVIRARGEEREKWYTGPGFQALLDFWIDLARKCSDTSSVDEALGLMIGSTSLRDPSSASTNGKASTSRTITSPEQAEAYLNKLYAQLTFVDTTLAAHAKNPNLPAAHESLRGVQWDLLVNGLPGLKHDENGKELFAKSYRAMERARRRTRDLHRMAASNAHEASAQWLLSATDAVEKALTGTNLTAMPSYADYITSAVSSITSVLYRSPAGAESAAIMETIARGRRLSYLSIDPYDRALCLRTLANTTLELCTRIVRASHFETGALVAQQSIELINNAIDSVRDPSKLESSEWETSVALRITMYSRWFKCVLGLGDHEKAISIACESLTGFTPGVYKVLESATSIPAVRASLPPADLATVEAVVEQLGHKLSSDLEPISPEVIEARISKLFTFMTRGNVQKGASTILLEMVFESVARRAFKEDTLQTAFSIGRRLLLLPDGVHMRKLRLVSRMMLLIGSSGINRSEFDDLVSRATNLIKTLRTDPATDPTLIAEYHAIILMIQAFQAYQINEEPTPHVIPLATEAIDELRQLLVPLTKSSPAASPPRPGPSASTVKGTNGTARPQNGRTATSARAVSVSTPASKTTKGTLSKRRRSSGMPITQFDDVSRLADMLTSLISLLGLLGHVTAKVDGIKVLRALIRYREDHLDEYLEQSAELAFLYSKLGKHTRATAVFSQITRTVAERPGAIAPSTQLAIHLRHCEHLASLGDHPQALASFAAAEEAFYLIETVRSDSSRHRVMNAAAELARLADAYRALAAIRAIKDDAAGSLSYLKTSVLLNARVVARLAILATDRPQAQPTTETKDENPFVVPTPPPEKTGQDQPSKDAVVAAKSSVHAFTNKYTFGTQWRAAENVLNAYTSLADAYAQRGSAQDAIYYLRYVEVTARAVRASTIVARAATRAANLRTRMQMLEVAEGKIGEASAVLTLDGGPDMFDLQRAKGDLLARQEMAAEANEVFEAASRGIHGLDTVFSAADALLPTPKKEAVARASLALSTIRTSKEPLLPSTLSHVLRRQAWLFREAGLMQESDELYKQVKLLQTSGDSKAEESYLAGKLALDDAFNHFQSDLFMSSLTESTIAMPMGSPGKKVDHRLSTRHRIQIILEQADQAYQSALSLVAGSGRVEDVRQACLSLALLRAFQTSLGQGGAKVTSFAADLLASSTSIGLHRELLEAIESKFAGSNLVDVGWPSIDGARSLSSSQKSKVPLDPEAEEDVTTDPALVEYWGQVRAKHTSRSFLSPDSPSYDLSVLPTTWAVVSMSVTEDRNTMFISRHQNGHEPLVLCLPMDRQSKREGEEEDVFTFEAGLAELHAIIQASDYCSKTAKSMETPEEKVGWWNTKRALDKRMKDLTDNVEFCWLGAFKTIFNPRRPMTPSRLQLFRGKIEKVFNLALFGSAHDSKKHGKVHLSDALLECFATLSSKSRDEEIEDFIYFILDIYQFHGVPVAVSELDLDQVGIDVVTALTEMEASARLVEDSVHGPEHLLLALDKNVQAFPWESIPCLRGRPVSRVPSLPVLLDQVALGKLMQPNSERRKVNTKRTHFILNPSGDLKNTQETFEPFLKDMQERAGWRGSIGTPPAEMEMRQILEGNELVLYFGHGGGEQYIQGAKVRSLAKCATVFLWGCSSGKLEDQGDLDPAGTAWNYMMAGCPSLTATLWDVTDRDIDRYTHSVYKRLGLDPAHVMQQEKPRAEHSNPALLPLSGQGLGLSTIEAVNASRDDCKLTYLTGAAVVHYGIPVYLY